MPVPDLPADRQVLLVRGDRLLEPPHLLQRARRHQTDIDARRAGIDAHQARFTAGVSS